MSLLLSALRPGAPTFRWPARQAGLARLGVLLGLLGLQSLAARLERTSTGTAPRWEVLYDQRGLMLLRWHAAAASSGTTGMAGRAARTAPAAL